MPALTEISVQLDEWIYRIKRDVKIFCDVWELFMAVMGEGW